MLHKTFAGVSYRMKAGELERHHELTNFVATRSMEHIKITGKEETYFLVLNMSENTALSNRSNFHP